MRRKVRIKFQELTIAEVIQQIAEAVRTLRYLPDKERAWLSKQTNWPEFVRTFGDIVGTPQETHYRRILTARQITRMNEAIIWLTWLDPKDAKIVWAACENFSWRRIGRMVGLDCTTCKNHFDESIIRIAFRARKK